MEFCVILQVITAFPTLLGVTIPLLTVATAGLFDVYFILALFSSPVNVMAYGFELRSSVIFFSVRAGFVAAFTETDLTENTAAITIIESSKNELTNDFVKKFSHE